MFGFLARDFDVFDNDPETIDLEASSNSDSLTMLSADVLRDRCEAGRYSDCDTPIAATCWTDDLQPEVCVATPRAPEHRPLGVFHHASQLSSDGESIVVDGSVRMVRDGSVLAEPRLDGADEFGWFGRTGLVRQRLDGDLIISETDGTIVDQIAVGTRGLDGMTVSPDGSTLVFRERFWGSTLQAFDRNDREWRNLVDDPGYSYLWLSRPSFSADGSLLFTSRFIEEEPNPDGRRRFELVAIDVASGSVEVLQAMEAETVLTSISPDGTRAALYSADGQLVVMSLETGRVSAPTAVCCGQAGLTWSPHGDFLISQQGGLVIVEGADAPVLVGPFDMRVRPDPDPWRASFAWS